MRWRSNTDASTASKWVTSRWPGLGVPVSEIPVGGESGDAYLRNDAIELNAAPDDELTGHILTKPAVGTFTTDEYSRLIFSGAPDGVYFATYEGKRNGVVYGTFTITMNVGTPADTSMSANAQAEATATAQLSTQISLVASAVSVATATASLTAGAIDLAAAAECQSSVTADLTTSIWLQASAVIAPSASADLLTQITLSAHAVATSRCTANLFSELVPIECRRVTIRIEPKVFKAVMNEQAPSLQ